MGRPPDLSASPAHLVSAQPFLKWAGGKGQLLEQLGRLLPDRFDAYHEPFLGGGAMFFNLVRMGRCRGRVTLSDVNPNLICTWRQLQGDVETVIAHLARLADAYDPRDRATFETNKRRFNELRDHYDAEKAALMICLNRTGFNGLYRENSKGLYNVPVGRYANPRILFEPGLRAVNRVLQGAAIDLAGFDRILDDARPGDFVYFDPPYHPLNLTSQFTRYSRDDFTEQDQRRLGQIFEALTERGVLCMLSNSAAGLIETIYGEIASRHREVRLHRVSATRSINSKAEARGAIAELVVTNYPIP